MQSDKARAPRVRFATEADAESIRGIYAPYIDKPVTFEEEVPTREEFLARVRAIRSRHPYLVAEDASGIVGYAYAHELRERVAYQWNAELSVYLAPHAQGCGLGSALYRALIELLRLQGIKAVYGVVTNPNPASEHLHRAFGFTLMGVQPHAGYTCGAWHDMNWFVKEIAPFEDEPKAPTPFPVYAKAHPEQVNEAIAEANRELEARFHK